VSVLVLIVALALVAAVIVVIAAPLRRGRASAPAQDGEREELEAQREAKYREIKDADLDYRMGKLSQEDHEAIDAALRSEALEILNRLERHGAEATTEGTTDGTTEGATPRDA
jgi:hypothetical protein